MSHKIKVALVVGHSQDAPGAIDLAQRSERSWCDALVKKTNRACLQMDSDALETQIFYRSDTISGYNAKMIDLVDRINAWGADYIIAFHFNSVVEPTPNDWGVVVLHHPNSSKGKQLAEHIGTAVAVAQGTRLKSILAQDTSWAGAELHILTRTTGAAIILETHYGVNQLDMDRATAARKYKFTPVYIAATLRYIATTVKDIEDGN